jgi:hypothetical protein
LLLLLLLPPLPLLQVHHLLLLLLLMLSPFACPGSMWPDRSTEIEGNNTSLGDEQCHPKFHECKDLSTMIGLIDSWGRCPDKLQPAECNA